jgi:hypothetical protein
MRIRSHIIVLLAVAFSRATTSNSEPVEKKEDSKIEVISNISKSEATTGLEYEAANDNYLLLTSNEGDESDVLTYDQRIRLARTRWKKTFEEIQSIAVDFSPDNQKKEKKEKMKFFDQWKLLLDGENHGVSRLTSNATVDDGGIVLSSSDRNSTVVDAKVRPKRSRQRFDGFASWDKLLQQWADDAQQYSSKEKDLVKSKSERLVRVDLLPREKEIRFSPRPARAGQEILPHTDIGDKSKNIWIVTTAALPWMTGTAVNPLLRAAYMAESRKEAVGKVTLMLPWLELEKDRDKIYGKEREFDTSEEQEKWIRSWLSEKAGLKDAPELLNIAWYMGRHETLENSIYSMGDITAMIPVSSIYEMLQKLSISISSQLFSLYAEGTC